MRNNIITSLMQEMERDENIFFLTADMGINLVEQIQDKFPTRYANVGIAEQNMIGVAAGLANLGYKPFVYTISNFVIHRCFEQIRNDIILHQYPITLIGTSTGFDNAPLGPTHHIIDDWGCLRSLPGIDIYCPSSISYADLIISKVLLESKPAYIRIPKGEFINPQSNEDLVFINNNLNSKTLLISYGSPAQECLKSMNFNEDISVLIFNKLTSFDNQKLLLILNKFQKIIVLEDHFSSNGMYSIICQICNKFSISTKIISIAPDSYFFTVGTDKDYFYEKIGIDFNNILKIS